MSELTDKTVPNKKILSLSTFVTVLLIAVSVMTFLTVKKFFEVGMVVTPAQAEIKKLSRLVNKNPNSLETRLKLAYSFQKSKQFEEAINQYNEVLKADPENAAALYNLAVIAWESEDEREATGLLAELLKKHPGHVLGSVKMGNIYLRQKKYDDALKVADDAIREKPSVVELRIVRAKALEAKGDYNSAVFEYREVLKYVPDYKEAISAIDRIY